MAVPFGFREIEDYTRSLGVFHEDATGGHDSELGFPQPGSA